MLRKTAQEVYLDSIEKMIYMYNYSKQKTTSHGQKYELKLKNLQI